ncbi:MAG: PLP-dependent aminotransferase family protein [Lachnospiraceae bacterium]|nr:PLP-dependent aminotransferase family protein [Lachnospiraceae bacterium]
MKTALENEELSRYLRVYQYYKELILNGKLLPDTKLPSIRKGSQQLQMSRTTMESAYLLLAAEGYIISKPQSGYYVTDIAEKLQKQEERQSMHKKEAEEVILYDFATSNVDKESFRFELWRRYMKSALRQDERLLSYGEPQGELEFREVLCQYLQKERNVICTPEQIVIGAGVQSLFHILCPLLNRKRVLFRNQQFVHGRAIFEDYGFEIIEDQAGEKDIFYISPSQISKAGGILQIQERMNLIREASEKQFLIIEDDYNSEFQYFQKPMPSLQGLAGGRGVVYLGTFSKMLLPSIRMSFMVLPPEMLKLYEKRKNLYNQTASKAEQIAITQYIRDGHLSSQIRKSRKIHQEKSNALAKVLKKQLGNQCKIRKGESGFSVYVSFTTDVSVKEIAEKARKKGIAVIPITDTTPALMLNCANVAISEYETAIKLLKECLV